MTLSSLSPWLSRLIIAAAAALFAMIGFKFVVDPQQAAAGAGVAIAADVGATNIRAGFGGFPLGLAAILVFCLFSSRRLFAGLGFIATVAAVILSVRLFGAVHDSTLAQSTRILIPETAMLAVSLLGILIEKRRRAA